MTVDDDSGSDLNEEPGGDQGQAAVLTVETIVIGVEGKVVQIEESGNKQQVLHPWIYKRSIICTL